MKRSVYIPDDKWPEIEKAAAEMNRSVSWYLVYCHAEREELILEASFIESAIAAEVHHDEG